ncbi:MAG: dTMP kinase [Nitrososphaeraceae archaeon]|jgi:dTMP kinase
MPNGKIIVLEGIDKSGKTTQSKLLVDYISSATSFNAVQMNFPNYSTFSGIEIHRHLKGQTLYNPHALHVLFTLNRYEEKPVIERLLDEGTITVMNRYYQSNIIYGLADGITRHEWLESLDGEMPQANLIIILDISVEESMSRNSNPDINEQDKNYLRKVRNYFLKYADAYGWKIVDANNKSKEEIHIEVIKIAERYKII